MSETALLDPIIYPGPKGYVEPEAIGRIMDLKSSAPRLRIVRNGSVQAERYSQRGIGFVSKSYEIL